MWAESLTKVTGDREMKPSIRKPTQKEQKEAKEWPIWEKEESEFPWEYDEKETCLIPK